MRIDERLKEWATPRQAQFIDAVNAEQGAVKTAALKLGIDKTAVYFALASVRKKAARAGYAATAAPATPASDAAVARPRTLDEDLALARARATAAAAVAREKEQRARIVELEDELARVRAVVDLNPRAAEWTLSPKAGRKAEHIPYLLTSDHQLGEVIRAAETEAGYGYDVATYRRRYRALIETAIRLCQDHAAEWRFPGFIYARGGDTISGAIHEELEETDELTALEAVTVAFEEEAAGIRHLADAFGKVEVKDVGGGNHDRNTRKPRSKRAPAHSYDTLVGYMLRREFAGDKRVTFQGTESPDVRFRVYERRILLTHGDKIGSRGGHGFIGPAATILRGAQKIIAEQATFGTIIDEVHMGHFHTFLDVGWTLCNGCLPGYSEFAKLNRMRPGPPEQTLSFFHPVHGRRAVERIFLEVPRQPPAD